MEVKYLGLSSSEFSKKILFCTGPKMNLDWASL